jgi:hypothetical protein
MNTVLFLILIMMIIIFINELKNISLSFFKINYIKDVSDINIKKYCNDIYCEAETARFKIADSSYNLLSPNDIFNTKSYYIMILIIIIAIYANIFYNLIEYNNIYCSTIDNTNGNIISNIIKALPILLAIAIFVFAIIIIIARYIPDSKEGYINYFNYDNPTLRDINSYNIANISYYALLSIIIIGILYITISLSANILEFPNEEYIKGSKYRFLSIGYFIIILMFSYLLLNFMNILLTFSENKYPKLDDDILNAILNKLENKITNLSDIYNTKSINGELYKKYTKLTDLTDITVLNRLVSIDDKYKYISSGTTSPNKDFIDLQFNDGEGTIKYRINGDSISKSIDNGTSYIPNDADLKNFKINNVFFTTKEEYDLFFNSIDASIKPANNTYNPEDILKNVRIMNLNDISPNGLYDKIIKKIEEYSYDVTKKENVKILLKILICFSINEMKDSKDVISREIASNETDNITKNITKNNYYKKHVKLVELTDYIIRCINNSKEIESNDGINKIKNYITEYNNHQSLSTTQNTSITNLFGFDNDPDPFSTTLESEQNYSVDFSYNSENVFYERYYNFLENLNKPSYYDLEYGVGSYYIKNIKTLAYFILMIFGVAIIYLIIFYIQYNDIIYKFFDEIILPVIILSIFILYIIVFINFNTNYNLNFIYGALNSSYKRDLNDLNNMITPFIRNSYKRDSYKKGPYHNLYIITNVLMSFIYHNDGGDLTDFTQIGTNIPTDIAYDYDNFKEYHNILGNLIYDKMYTKEDTGGTLIPNADTNLIAYINRAVSDSDNNIIHITDNIENFKKYIGKFNSIKDDLINIINNLINSSFKDKKDQDITKFLDKYVLFYKSNTGGEMMVWNKFLLKKKFFEDYKKHKVGTLSGDDSKAFNKLIGYTGTYDKSYIDEYVDEYVKILSHYHFNTLIKGYTPIANGPSVSNVLTKIKAGTGRTDSDLSTFINNYRNKKLFRLLLLQTQNDQNKKLNVDDTFNIDNVLFKKANLTIYDEFKEVTDLHSMYYKLLESGLINLDKSDNYLMNIIKSIYYQINNKRIEYYIPPNKDTMESSGCKKYKIIQKKPFEHETIINDNANNTIGYELFGTYFINIVMIGIIYNLALIKNNNINKLF